MHSRPVDVNYLAAQAARCRRLAEGFPNETVRQKMLALAAEYEARMLAIINDEPIEYAVT
jgi:hypothetical protein